MTRLLLPLFTTLVLMLVVHPALAHAVAGFHTVGGVL